MSKLETVRRAPQHVVVAAAPVRIEMEQDGARALVALSEDELSIVTGGGLCLVQEDGSCKPTSK